MDQVRVATIAVYDKTRFGHFSEVRKCCHRKPCRVLLGQPLVQGWGDIFMPECISKHAGENFTFKAAASLCPRYEASYKFQEAVPGADR